MTNQLHLSAPTKTLLFTLLCCLTFSMTSVAYGQNGNLRTTHITPNDARYVTIPVQGFGVHLFSTAIEHSRQPTATGEIVRSTDTINLSGDLNGRVIYHPVTVLDYQEMTLVNTGHQVFSGTILGSDPVLLLDRDFRFQVNLRNGATEGKVYLETVLAGPRIRCELDIRGTGMTESGDSAVGYTGLCHFYNGDKK